MAANRPVPVTEVDATDLTKLLLDPDRLAVVGAVARFPRRAADVAEVTGLAERDVVRTLGLLVADGLVARQSPETGVGSATYVLDGDALAALARDQAEALPLAPRIGFGMTEDEQRILARFFDGDRLTHLPAVRSKRLVVLERLALEFEPGERYPEAEVNRRLRRFDDDHSTLRRALVDEGLLGREPGTDGSGRATQLYWRSGGRLT